MYCTNCGNAVAPNATFCSNCGARQADQPSFATPLPSALAPAVAAPPAPTMPAPSSLSVPARAGRSAIWVAVVALVLAAVGGVGYWGWNNKVARDEAVQKLAGDAAARKTVAEKAAEAAEIKTAQALLARHIAAEEAEAQAQRP